MNLKRRNIFTEFLASVRKPKSLPLVDRQDDRMITLVRQLKSENPIERKSAAKKLKKHSERAKPYLERLLMDKTLDVDARLNAVRILGGIGGPSLNGCPAENPGRVRMDPRIIQELQESLRRTTDPKIRKSIIDALEKLGCQQVI